MFGSHWGLRTSVMLRPDSNAETMYGPLNAWIVGSVSYSFGRLASNFAA